MHNNGYSYRNKKVFVIYYLIFFTTNNKHITTYCEKTIESTNESIKNTETTLRNLTKKQKFLNLDKILQTTVEATKRQL